MTAADVPVVEEADAARAVERRWRDRFTISYRGATIRLTSKRTGVCGQAVQRPVRAMALVGTPVEVLFNIVTQDPDASRRLPPGIVGGGLGAGRAASWERLQQHLTLDVAGGTPLAEALDDLVAAGLPLGWGVIERRGTAEAPCQLILFTESTVVWTSYDATRIAP